MRRNALMNFEPCSTVYVGLCGRVRNGGCCQMICHRGTPCINKRNAGSQQACSRIWCMTCEPCCDWQKARKNNLLRQFLMVAPYSLRLKAESEQGTMGINGKKEAKFILPLMSHLPTNRSVLKS